MLTFSFYDGTLMTLWDFKANFYRNIRSLPPLKQIVDREIEGLKALLSKTLSNSMLILDIGTGTGMVQRILPGNTRIFGIDKSLKMIEKNGGGNLFTGIVGEACCLPIKDRIFPLISAIGLTEYLSDKNMFLKEVKRILRPGGYFLVTIAPPSLLNKLRNLLGNRIYTVRAGKWETLAGEEGFICIGHTQSLLQIQYLFRLTET